MDIYQMKKEEEEEEFNKYTGRINHKLFYMCTLYMYVCACVHVPQQYVVRSWYTINFGRELSVSM